jgi:hypothetical protein
MLFGALGNIRGVRERLAIVIGPLGTVAPGQEIMCSASDIKGCATRPRAGP